MTTPTEAAQIAAWLKKNKPTRCPTVAVSKTSATITPAAITWLHSREELPKPPIFRGVALKKASPAVAPIDRRYHKLVVIRYSHKKGRYHFWLFRCDCGNEKVINSSYLQRGTRSCGCLRGREKKVES